MTINDWHEPHNTVEDFQKEFANMSNEQLFAIAEKWKGSNPEIAASLIISKRKRNKKLILIGVVVEVVLGLLVAFLVMWLTG